MDIDAKLDLVTRLQAWGLAHVPNLVRALLIPIVAYFLVRAGVSLIRRMERFADDGDDTLLSEREKRAKTLVRILTQTVRVSVWTLALVLVLAELGVDIKPILAGAGIVGLAVGFGAQTLVKDLITGFFLLLENQIRVNDVVSAGGVSGLVEEINLRTTVLRDVSGNVHIIPNGSITTVTNMTREWARAVLDIGVAYESDVDECMAVLRRVAAAMADDPAWKPLLVGPFEFPGIERFEESAVVLRIMVQTRPIEQWNVMRELRRRVKTAFQEAGISIPYPHRTVITKAG